MLKLDCKKIFILLFVLLPLVVLAADESDLASRLSGRILLQVESRGEAWYLNPLDLKRYYLGRPADAFELMKKTGVGITDKNLNKIPVNIMEAKNFSSLEDSDNDDLTDDLEKALGTDANNPDSDNDGYSDRQEIINNYNPLGAGKLLSDAAFAKTQAGKIFLQVESRGEAWYLNPLDLRRYYLGRPADAFELMKKMSLGISNQDLNQIPIAYFQQPAASQSPGTSTIQPPPTQPTISAGGAQLSLNAAAAAIRSGDTDAVKYFTAKMETAVKYTINFLNDEGRLILGNIMSGSSLSESTDNEKIYSNEVNFSLDNSKVKVNFKIKKQPDGSWLIDNL